MKKEIVKEMETKEVKEVKKAKETLKAKDIDKVVLTTNKEYGKAVEVKKGGRRVERNFNLPALDTVFIFKMELDDVTREAIIDRVSMTLGDLQTRSKNGFGEVTITVEDKKVKITGLDTKDENELKDKILMRFNNYGYENGYYYKYVRFYKPVR